VPSHNCRAEPSQTSVRLEPPQAAPPYESPSHDMNSTRDCPCTTLPEHSDRPSAQRDHWMSPRSDSRPYANPESKTLVAECDDPAVSQMQDCPLNQNVVLVGSPVKRNSVLARVRPETKRCFPTSSMGEERNDRGSSSVPAGSEQRGDVHELLDAPVVQL